MMTNDPLTMAGEERRIHLELRVIFVEAYEIVRPFFDVTNNWGGHSLEHLAYRALQEHFPTLSSEQVFIIVSASKRLHGSSSIPAPHE